MSIAVINLSTVVSDADGQILVSAINQILPQFCKDWNLPLYKVVYVGKGKTTPIVIKVRILDASYIPGALGYHDFTSNIPAGKCFATTVLESGGAILYSPTGETTVAQVVAHEIFELLIDPQCNGWWDIGDGETLFARETCDPVQGNDIIVQVITSPAKTLVDPRTRKIIKKPATVQKVGLSDWILPAWSNPQNTVGPFNHLKTLKAPFTLDKGGYVILITNAEQGQTFAMKIGSEVTEEQKEKYIRKSSRLPKKTT
jgi:hypothetical protein